MLRGFVVPAPRLEELDRQRDPWRLAIVFGRSLEADVAAVARFRARRPEMGIESIEIAVRSAAEIVETAGRLPPQVAPVFELPLGPGLEERIAAVGAVRGLAKVRAGGADPGQVPDPDELADFLVLSARAGVPFKATAGLHHPIRGSHSDAGAPGGSGVTMHGFINVFVAAVLVDGGLDRSRTAQLLDERSPAAIGIDRDRIVWRDLRVDRTDIARARRRFALSFGSCSMRDPIAGLEDLGYL
jgi:hypothetical protein